MPEEESVARVLGLRVDKVVVAGNCRVRVGLRVLGMGETEIEEIAAMEGGGALEDCLLCLKPLLDILSQSPTPRIT